MKTLVPLAARQSEKTPSTGIIVFWRRGRRMPEGSVGAMIRVPFSAAEIVLGSKIPQMPMNRCDHYRSLSDGGGHSFDRARPHIAYSKDPSHRRFERTSMVRS